MFWVRHDIDRSYPLSFAEVAEFGGPDADQVVGYSTFDAHTHDPISVADDESATHRPGVRGVFEKECDIYTIVRYLPKVISEERKGSKKRISDPAASQEPAVPGPVVESHEGHPPAGAGGSGADGAHVDDESDGSGSSASDGESDSSSSSSGKSSGSTVDSQPETTDDETGGDAPAPGLLPKGPDGPPPGDDDPSPGPVDAPDDGRTPVLEDLIEPPP